VDDEYMESQTPSEDKISFFGKSVMIRYSQPSNLKTKTGTAHWSVSFVEIRKVQATFS
jgi:hypothetical protein